MKLCNRSACRAPNPTYWNTSTRAWYCEKCAKAINEGAGTHLHGVPLCLHPYALPGIDYTIIADLQAQLGTVGNALIQIAKAEKSGSNDARYLAGVAKEALTECALKREKPNSLTKEQYNSMLLGEFPRQQKTDIQCAACDTNDMQPTDITNLKGDYQFRCSRCGSKRYVPAHMIPREVKA